MDTILKVFAFLTLQLLVLLLVGLFLWQTDNLPKYELSLAWNAVWTGKSAADQKMEPEALKEVPSYEDQLEAITRTSRELEREEKQLESLRLLGDSRKVELDTTFEELTKLKEQLDQGLQKAETKLEEESRQKLVSILEVTKPKVVKAFFLDLAKTDANEVIGYIKALDPVTAAKIAKEFKEADEAKQLNQWLAKLGDGEPEKSKAEAMRAAMPKPQ